MICLCTYAGSSVSSPINPKQQEGSKSCRSCGGKLPVDKQGTLSESMLRTVGLELSRVINPYLNWKTTSKGRHRAVRRARRTFAAGNEKKSTCKNFSGCEDLTSKESRRTSEMAISESEKLGVTILGLRFSENLESIPIKKRRLLLAHLPSPPPQLSHHSDDSADIEESQSSLCDGDASYKKCPDLSLSNSGNRTKLHQDISADGEKTDLQKLDEKLCDTIDFSGISILAAAACESNMGCHAMYTGGSASKEQFSQVEKEICRMEDVDVKTNLASEASPLSLLPSNKSDGNKLDCPIVPNKSDSFLDSSPAKTTGVKLSSRHDRLQWDLNTVMDEWESCSDEALDCEPLGANVIGADDFHCTNLGNVEPHKYHMVTCDIKCSPEVVDNSFLGAEQEDHVRKEANVEEKPVVYGGNPVTHENQKQDSSLLHGSGLIQEGHALENASVPIVNAFEGTKPMCSRRKSSVTAGLMSSPVGGLVSYKDSSLIAAAPREEITRIICVEADVRPSLLVSCRKAGSGVTSADKSLSAQDQNSNFLYEEKTVEGSAADFYDHSAAAHLAENESKIMVDDTSNDMIEADGIAGGSTCLNAFNKTECGSIDKLIGEKLSSLPPDSHAIDSHGLINHDVLCSGDACVLGHETMGSCMKISDKCSGMADGNLNTTMVHSPTHIDSDSPEHNSADVKDGVLDAYFVEGPLNSHGTVTSDLHGNTTSSVQMGLHNHSHSDYYSDVSQSDTGQAVGMERIEFLGDEDYQYEDGEFRESFVKCWAEDGVDEGDTELLDYGSDSREMDTADYNSDIPPDGVRTRGLSDVGQDYKNGALVGRETQLTVSQSVMTCSFLKDVSDTGSARKRIKDVEKLEEDVKDTSESFSVNNIVRRDGVFINEGDDSRNLSQGMKLSGWDQLPKGSKCFAGAVVDSGVSAISQNLIDASFSGSFSARSSLGRELLSQTERLKSSDVLPRKDKSARRCNDLSDFDSRAQRDMGAPRSIGRGGSSMHVHGGGKQDAWVDSASQRGSSHHDSRVWYDPNNMMQPVPSNAAEATVTRLKNSGYVVSSNGTIIKAGNMGPAGNEPRRAAMSSSHSANYSLVKRRSSVERDGSFSMQLGLNSSREESPNRRLNSSQDRGVSAGRYAARMVSTSQKDRCDDPMTDNNRGMPLSPRHVLSRRKQSFSPCGRPLHQSRSRSPTRSRTRSPRFCTSQRGSIDRVKKGSGLQRHSRSPNFRHEVRIQRSRSPQRQSGLVEHMIGYASSSRNQSSLPNASRWLGKRKDFPDHFRQNEKNRLPDRSSPRRVLSRNHRINAVDSPGRDKSEEFYRPMHSENFDEFVDFDGGSRYAGADSERRGYEMLRPMRQYATNENMKRFPAEVKEGFRANHPQSRTPGFRQRGGLRGFEGVEESHLGGSRRRVKEDKGNVRYGRDRRHNADFKSFGDRDSAIEGTLQRRTS